jgi:hypothetical protein
MKPVQRDEILDYVTYKEQRDRIRANVLKQKEVRRVHVGKYLTFLFENHDTVLYQIQEMMRVEEIVKEADIVHEMETYNELLGAKGELGASLLIEIDDPNERDVLLHKWLDLPQHIYAKLDDGEKVYAKFDSRQVGDSRLSSVQYIKFDTKGRTPVALGADHPALTEETELTEAQKQALDSDLKG